MEIDSTPVSTLFPGNTLIKGEGGEDISSGYFSSNFTPDFDHTTPQNQPITSGHILLSRESFRHGTTDSQTGSDGSHPTCITDFQAPADISIRGSRDIVAGRTTQDVPKRSQTPRLGEPTQGYDNQEAIFTHLQTDGSEDVTSRAGAEIKHGQAFQLESSRSGQRSHVSTKSPSGNNRGGGGGGLRGSCGSGKRKRGPSDDGKRATNDEGSANDREEGDENDTSDVALEKSTKLLACQFHKLNPLKFRGPGKFKACQNGFLGFNRLKQHLRTVHQPKSYCMGCQTIFDSQDGKDNHDRNRGECDKRRKEAKPNLFDEMITSDRQRCALKRKLVSVPIDTHWFYMWNCLHGDVAPPASPFKESALDATDFVLFVKSRMANFVENFLRTVDETPSPQLLARFGQELLESAAAEYLQDHGPGQIQPSPSMTTVQDLHPPTDLGIFEVSSTGQSAEIQSSFDIAPTIVVTEEGRALDVYTNWDPSELSSDYWIIPDPMLGSTYRSQGCTVIPPGGDSAAFH